MALTRACARKARRERGAESVARGVVRVKCGCRHTCPARLIARRSCDLDLAEHLGITAKRQAIISLDLDSELPWLDIRAHQRDVVF